jgi:hypothetical protein
LFQKKNDCIICTVKRKRTEERILSIPVNDVVTENTHVNWEEFKQFVKQYPVSLRISGSDRKKKRYMSLDFGNLSGKELSGRHFQQLMEAVGDHNSEVIIAGKTFDLITQKIPHLFAGSEIVLIQRDKGVVCLYYNPRLEAGHTAFPSKKTGTEHPIQMPDWDAVKKHLVSQRKIGFDHYFVRPINAASCEFLFQLLLIYHDAGITRIRIVPYFEFDTTVESDSFKE